MSLSEAQKQRLWASISGLFNIMKRNDTPPKEQLRTASQLSFYIKHYPRYIADTLCEHGIVHFIIRDLERWEHFRSDKKYVKFIDLIIVRSEASHIPFIKEGLIGLIAPHLSLYQSSGVQILHKLIDFHGLGDEEYVEDARRQLADVAGAVDKLTDIKKHGNVIDKSYASNIINVISDIPPKSRFVKGTKMK